MWVFEEALLRIRSGLEECYPLLPGDVVLSLNGRDIHEIANDKRRFVSYQNEDKFLAAIAETNVGIGLLWSHTELIEIEVLRGDDRITMALEGMTHSFGAFDPNITRSHVLPDYNIGLINPSRLSSHSTIHRIMADFADTDGLIVDLRQYPEFGNQELMDSIAVALPEYLIPERRRYVKFSTQPVIIPDVFTRNHGNFAGGALHPDAYFYDRDVVVLMNNNTFSAGETTVMSIMGGPNVTLMGSNSAGANGNIAHLPLPGGLHMTFSSLGVFTPEGGQTQRIGLSPDIYVFRTIEGIREGRDELMEAAIEFLLYNR